MVCADSICLGKEGFKVSKKCLLRWRTDEPVQTSQDQTGLQPNSVVATPCWNPEHAIRTRRAVPWNCAHPQQPPVHRLELMSRNCSIDHIYFRYIFQNFFRTQKSNIFLQISELGGGFFCAEKERAFIWRTGFTSICIWNLALFPTVFLVSFFHVVHEGRNNISLSKVKRTVPYFIPPFEWQTKQQTWHVLCWNRGISQKKKNSECGENLIVTLSFLRNCDIICLQESRREALDMSCLRKFWLTQFDSSEYISILNGVSGVSTAARKGTIREI